MNSSADQKPLAARARKALRKGAGVSAPADQPTLQAAKSKTQVGLRYKHAEVAALFGLAVDKSWTQERMEWIVEVGNVVHPLSLLRKKAKAVHDNYVVPGRKAMRELMEETYGLFLKAEVSPCRDGVFSELRGQLKKRDVTVHKDAPDASVMVRSLFDELDSKQVHLYARSLQHAFAHGVTAKGFQSFVSDEGGFEAIRAKLAKQDVVRTKELTKKRTDHNEVRADEVLAFARTEPFLEVAISREQYFRLKPQTTKTYPTKNFDMVVLLAEMDRFAMGKLKVYATVPMTAELKAGIEAALGTHLIFNAGFAERFYAWQDQKLSKKKVV